MKGAVAAAVVALALGVATLASAEAWGPRWNVRRGPSFTVEHHVIDLQRGVVHARQRDEGHDAVVTLDLADGRPLWTSDRGLTPLFLEAGWLVVLDEGAPAPGAVARPATRRPTTAALLHVRDGRRVGDCTGVPSSLRTGESHSHATQARGLRVRRAPFLWTAHRTWYGGGAAPTPEEAEAARSEHTAAYAVEVSADRRCTFTPVADGALNAGERRYGVQRTREGRAWVFTVVGPRTQFLALRDEGLGDVVPSVDGRHVRARRQVAMDHGRIGYEWTYFDLAGERVAQHVHGRSTGGGFFVRGDALIELSSNAVTVMDLATGDLRWNRGLVSREPRRSPPPSRRR